MKMPRTCGKADSPPNRSGLITGLQKNQSALLRASYNSQMRTMCTIAILLIGTGAWAQSGEAPPLTIAAQELPSASLWSPYRPEHTYGVQLQAEGGIGARHWRIVSGSLPAGMKLDENSGMLWGSPEEAGEFEFTVMLSDSRESVRHKFRLIVGTPLVVEWDRKAQVSGNRIDGSIKVSNQTGRDFDLTFIVLAINGIGRATAIGYQHFSLKRETVDLQLPFGDTLSAGDYVVHVDVVAEEPISKRIFRARVVSGKESIGQGP
jgi:hypothetical protein